ncbi:MAG: Gfo/Idh/MocA family oxidoreductase [Treponema sp.]|jgi:predicted dehydrogenase|nr:Gfo/Idh/MocA family oxidoreductase [Treponema sp.]
MTNSAPVTAAIIGLGRIAGILEDDALREKPCTHAGAFAANRDCVLAAGCDTDENRRRLFAKKWRVPVYDDAEEMISVHKPGIVAIATHPDSHFYYCRLAARLGVALVICEKPLSDNLKEARKIVALTEAKTPGKLSLFQNAVSANPRFDGQAYKSKEAGQTKLVSLKTEGEPGVRRNSQLKIITNHERRYSADYIRAKEILDEGKLGAILSLRAVLYMGKTKRLLDVLWHDGTHLADALMFLTGFLLKHRSVRGAKLTQKKGTAWLEGELLNSRNKAKIPVLIELGAERDHLVFEIEVSCERGRLRIGNGVFEVWESAESPYAENFRSLKKTAAGFDGKTGYFANMIADAAACFRDPEKEPRSTAKDGLAVIEYLASVAKWH